jgi:hypothetical protein
MYKRHYGGGERESKTDGIETKNADQDDGHGIAATTYPPVERRCFGGCGAKRYIQLLQRQTGAVVGPGSTRGRLNGVAAQSARRR